MSLKRIREHFGFKTNKEWLKSTLQAIRDGFAIIGFISLLSLVF